MKLKGSGLQTNREARNKNLRSKARNNQVAEAQSETPRFEIGAQFAAIRFNEEPTPIFPPNVPGVGEWNPGFGGTFTFNFIDAVAFETETNLFLREGDILLRGKKIQALFGVKAGFRRDRFGIFGNLVVARGSGDQRTITATRGLM